MVMPGKVAGLSGAAGPVSASNQDRPVPAARRLAPGEDFEGQRSTLAAASEIGPSSPRRFSQPNVTMKNRTPSPQRRFFEGSSQRQQNVSPAELYHPHHPFQQRSSGYASPRPISTGFGNPRPVSTGPSNTRPVSAVRPQSAMAITSPSSERPPSSLSIAWSSANKGQPALRKTPHAVKSDGRTNPGGAQTSLESRLKSLVTSSELSREQGKSGLASEDATWRTRQKPGPATYRAETGATSHQRSYSHDGGIADTILGAPLEEEDLYAVIDKVHDSRSSFEAIPGYVTQSHYDDNMRPKQQQHLSSTPPPSQRPTAHHQQDNRQLQQGPGATRPHNTKDGPQPGGYDLRSAWQRLYGNRPNGAAAGALSGRKLSHDDVIDPSAGGDLPDYSRSYTQTQLENTHWQGHQSVLPSGSRQWPSNRPDLLGKQAPSSYFSNPNNSSKLGGAQSMAGASRNKFDGNRSRSHSQQSISSSQHSPDAMTGPAHSSSDTTAGNTPYPFGATSSTDRALPGRESPTGQSSSNPDQVSGSNNSSQVSQVSGAVNKLTTFKPEKKKWTGFNPENSPSALGPASKYPDAQSPHRSGADAQQARRFDARSSDNNLASHRGSPQLQHPVARARQALGSPRVDKINAASAQHRHRSDSAGSAATAEFTVTGELGLHHRPPSRKNPDSVFLDHETENLLMGDYPLGQLDSVFDYPLDDEDDDGDDDLVDGCGGQDHSDHDRSVTPPLPPLEVEWGGSPRHLPRMTIAMDASKSQRSSTVSPNTGSPYNRAKSPGLGRQGAEEVMGQESFHSKGRQQQGHSQPSHDLDGAENKRGRKSWRQNVLEAQHYKPTITDYVRSRSLEDVRESGNESVTSFDVDNTVLMVEPSDQSEMGTLRSQTAGSSVRAQLNRLEGMYSQVMKSLEERPRSHIPHGETLGGGGGSRARRRWSIGSSDTSSMRMRHHGHHRHGQDHGASAASGHGGRVQAGGVSATSGGRMSGRDVRAIGKRFQRLESHVITLARSVAHLSSELRSHNSVTREMENVKREIRELKSSREGERGYFDRHTMSQGPGHFMAGGDNPRLMTDFERYRGWVPSLTNPRRVNKLTKFFGQEPPLLEIFMKRLGYEKYVKNFEDEHIGMIELPYMTEDRLKSIGIPMGPRLRILQEAQMYFQQGNFDVYFV